MSSSNFYLLYFDSKVSALELLYCRMFHQWAHSSSVPHSRMKRSERWLSFIYMYMLHSWKYFSSFLSHLSDCLPVCPWLITIVYILRQAVRSEIKPNPDQARFDSSFFNIFTPNLGFLDIIKTHAVMRHQKILHAFHKYQREVGSN